MLRLWGIGGVWYMTYCMKIMLLICDTRSIEKESVIHEV